MKLTEENCNASFSTLSTDLSTAESKTSINTIYENASLKETEQKTESKEPLWKCRYVIVLIAFLAYFYVTYIRMNMSVSIVAMVNNSAIIEKKKVDSESCRNLIKNITQDEISSKMEGEFNWSPKTQGYILGCYYFGYVVSQMPSGLLAEKYGFKWFFFGCMLVTGICMLLVPSFTYLSTYALMVLQVITGLAQGFTQSCLAVLVANWLPSTERGFFYPFIYSGGSPGSCLGSIFTGYICESAGRWPVSFYVTGAGGILLTISIWYYVAENPKVHPRISKAEQDFIINNQENPLSRKRPKLPWGKMLKSVPVYALAYAYFGQVWAMSQFWIVHSTFLGTIFHYPIGKNGLLTAASFFAQFWGSQGAILISFCIQKKTVVGVDFLRKFWNSIACLGVSLCLLGMYLVGCNRDLIVIFGIIAAGCTGIGVAGCWIVPPDMSPTFAGTIHGFSCTIGLLSGCLVPVVAGYLTNEMQTIEQWNKFFFISIGIVMSSGIVFTIFGSAKLQPWNFVEPRTPEKDKNCIKNNQEQPENENYKNQIRF